MTYKSKNPLNIPKKEKWKRMLKNATIATAISFISYQGLQIEYLKNQIKNELNPPEKFYIFEKQTGIKIKGFDEDIDNKILLQFIEVIQTEKITLKQLDELIIESSDYSQKSTLGKFAEINNRSGIANPLTNTVTLNKKTTQLLIHELAHILTYEKKIRKELLDKWIQISGEKNYMTFPEVMMTYSFLSNDSLFIPKKIDTAYVKNKFNNQIDLDTLKPLIQKDSAYFAQRKIINDSLGFVNGYTRTNVLEDIAEIIERELYKIYYNDTELRNVENQYLRKKIELASQYNLLPKEIFERYDLKEIFIKSVSELDGKIKKDKKQSEILINKSKEFMKKHPNSKSYNYVLIDKIISESHNFHDKKFLDGAISELHEALLSKNKIGYINMLEVLEDLTKIKYSKERINPYAKAISEYNRRIEKLDVDILINGVNDELINLGVLKNDK